MTNLSVLAVASEFYPLVKTGGLADVAGALPAALAAHEVTVTTLIPGYPAVLSALKDAVPVCDLSGLLGSPSRLLAGKCGSAAMLALDAPHLFTRDGGIYGWPDDGLRFGSLARVGAAIAQGGLVPNWRPDVVHCHDWQAALLPAYLRFGDSPSPPPSVVTVHNLAFQGQFPSDLLPTIGLPWHAYTLDGVEYWGGVGFLKAGLRLADRITTVSPTYADEIRTKQGGMGLDGVLRARGSDVSGILNGIDLDVWNPATDATLPQRFTKAKLDKRAANKAKLCARLGISPQPLLFGVVSRLTWQKGLDLLPHAIGTMMQHGANLAILGSGDGDIERGVLSAAQPGGVGLVLGYDEPLAHLIYAGADALLIPSRFEPCGLTQLCAMRYGCLPVVSRVGGLADTVIDANLAALEAEVATGFQFSPVDAAALDAALGRVVSAWRDQTVWRRIQRNAMTASVGWSRSAGRYAEMYRELAGQTKTAAM